MTRHGNKPGADDHEVGYGKPPAHTRFRKGQSGNPGGRPRGITAGRANALALKEAYRSVLVREGDKVMRLPAFQAVLRALVAIAAKGNGPAQRTLLETVQAIERENTAQAAAKESAQVTNPDILETGRSIAFALALAQREQERKEAHAAASKDVSGHQYVPPIRTKP
jgi:hypothetical protein